MTTASLVRVALAVAALLVIFLAVTSTAQIAVRRDAVVAAARAAVQLALVALVIAWVFRHPGAVAVYLPVMVLAAAETAARRTGLGRSALLALIVAIVAGAAAALVPVLASGALALRAQTVLPFAAQVIGGAMTAASLTGSRLQDDARAQWHLVEGGLALGATPRQAASPLARHSAARALVPAIDQTRSAGLVTLPGAFVGLLLGGASPALAAQVQLLVLVGLLAAEAVTAALTAHLLAGRIGFRRPAPVAG